MKNYIILLFLAILAQPVKSQSCIREISTNPNNPYNSEWQAEFPNGNGSFINTGFSWYPDATIPIYRDQLWNTPFWDSTANVPLNMYWPFANGNGEHTWFLNTQVNPKTLNDGDARGMDIPEEQKDFHWEDGWELLYLNVGKLPNGERIDQKSSNAWNTNEEHPTPSWAPYFVLYNRYRGTLRVFFNTWIEGEVYDKVSLRFADGTRNNNFHSGVFRHASGIDHALDQKSKIDGLSAIQTRNVGAINHNQWYVADFQMGYDVCQCEIPSKMVLVFHARNNITADLITRSISLEESVLNHSGLDNKFFQTRVDANGEYSVPGNAIFTSFYDLTATYNDVLASYPDATSFDNEVKREIVNAGTKAVLGGIEGMALPNQEMSDFLLTTQLKVNGNTILDPQNASDPAAWTGKLQAGLKSVLGSEFDFLSSVIDISQTPSAPQVPVATFAGGAIKGELTELNARETEGLLMPGTSVPNSNTTSHEFPVYNNVMGLFAMLETPKYKINITQCKSKVVDFWEEGSSDANLEQRQKLALQLKKLHYAVNPALDFDFSKTTFNAAIVVTYKGQQSEDINTTLELSNFKVNHQITEDGGNITTEFISDYYSLEELSNTVFQLNALFSKRLNISQTMRYNQFDNQLVSIKLRVLADMYFDQLGSNGAQVTNFQVFTYDLWNKAQSNGEVYEGQEEYSSWTALANHHGQVELEGVISPTDPEVWEVNGNEIVIKAEKVTLKENVQPQNGYHLKILFSGSVNMDPNAVLLQNIEIINTDFHDNEPNALTLVNDDLIQSYCNSKYQANVLDFAKAKTNLNEDDKDSIMKLRVKCYPNPANNEINVKVVQGELENCQVRVFSSAGHVLINEMVADNLQNGFAITTSQLTNGYYILELRSGNEVIRQQFVVQH